MYQVRAFQNTNPIKTGDGLLESPLAETLNNVKTVQANSTSNLANFPKTYLRTEPIYMHDDYDFKSLFSVRKIQS